MFAKRLFCALSSLMLGCAPALGADSDNKPVESVTLPSNIAPCQSWRNPIGKPQFALLCIHGLGLYSKSYDEFAKRLSRRGGAIYAIDVRGFGSWMKANGHEKVNFDACLGDIKSTLEAIRQANPGLPVFLLGESMGGAIALRATSMYPELIDGLISSVPAEERFKTKKTDLKVALNLLKGGPNHEFNIGKDIVEQASTAERYEDGKKVKVINKDLQTEWGSDPLDRMDLSAKELIQFQEFMNDNHDAVKKIDKVPVLFVQGLDDKLVKPEGTWELVEEIRTPDRMMMALPSRHLVFEEMQTANPRVARAATQLVHSWINSHILGDDYDPAMPLSRPLSSAINAAPDNTPEVQPLAPAPDIAQGKPTIVAFFADWAQQCGRIQPVMDQCESKFGSHLNLVRVDVNAPDSKDLLKRFSVATVPTLVFLKADGTVSSTIMGATEFPNIAKSIALMLGKQPGELRAAGPLGRPGLKRRAQFRAVGK